MHVVVWKQFYINYQLHHPNLVFIEETFKYFPCDILKELKIGTNNEKRLERATLQCDEMLECFKGHG
jgi:hypothetical protein